MRVMRQSLVPGAETASGLVVIIDVFRAFSCAPLFFYFGAKKVILEADPRKATAMKKKDPGRILVGEINEVPLKDADLGNSPSEIILKGEAFFRDRVVVHRTTAGVTGVSRAIDRADEVILGSFLTARAVAAYVRTRNPERVTLVPMGDRGTARAPEDEACGDYLEYLISGKPYDPIKGLQSIVFQQTAQKFITGSRPYLPREDPIICLQRDLFDFVLLAEKQGEWIVVLKKSV